MEKIWHITGGAPLHGTVLVSGSKNAALPAMVASLLTKEAVLLYNVPDITDVHAMVDILRHVGVEVRRVGPNAWWLRAASVARSWVGPELAGRLRASHLLLGALCARTGTGAVAKSGGDPLGRRPAAALLKGLRGMDTTVYEDANGLVVIMATRLVGVDVEQDKPNVTETELLMLAAAMAHGTTVITRAAREPHVSDLARCLIAMGADITGAGTDHIIIKGSKGRLLHGTDHEVTGDYIEAGTYMLAAAAMPGSDVRINGIEPDQVTFLVEPLRRAGVGVIKGRTHIEVTSNDRISPVDISTWGHPSFATDLQPQYTAVMTQAAGDTVVEEWWTESRFGHVAGLVAFGANITVDGRRAIVRGPTALHAADVRIHDIRQGAAYVIAALCAKGTSVLRRVDHLHRGYEDPVGKLTRLGATIEVEEVDAEITAGRVTTPPERRPPSARTRGAHSPPDFPHHRRGGNLPEGRFL